MGRIVTSRAELGTVLDGVGTGLVPTMGALHDGHRSLIRRSAEENDRTVVSIFVNPAQFNDPSDAAAYPRDPAGDAASAFEAGAGVVFAPSVDEVYPPGFATAVEVGDLGERWEGAARPGHFRGVATVVSILINLVRPDRSYFGEKDYQQLRIVRRLHADLALPGGIVECPTVRQVDGLAMSSRNARLSSEDRARAASVPRALFSLAAEVTGGETDATRLVAQGTAALEAVPGLRIDYLAVVDGETLEPLDRVVPGARALVAVEVGGVRLIDNLLLDPQSPAGSAEGAERWQG